MGDLKCRRIGKYRRYFDHAFLGKKQFNSWRNTKVDICNTLYNLELSDEIPILEHMSKMKLQGQKQPSDEPREPRRKVRTKYVVDFQF